MKPPAPILEARRLTKRFGAAVALRDVSFDLRPGEVHALCGENGAGKSTLIKTLSGLHPYGSYEGQILLNGQEVRFRSLADSTATGIAVIQQELALVGHMSVAENIFLGREPRTPWGLVDYDRAEVEAAALLQRFRVAINPATPVHRLGVGERQLVEIVKALHQDSRVLILDEPTAALAEAEVEILLDIVRRLREEGVAIIYISHKLNEVRRVADRITVLRDGASIGTWPASELDIPTLIRHMVGREISDLYPRERTAAPSEVLLEVENLSAAPAPRAPARLRHISFQVRAGEVLGIGGLMGAGRSELLLHLFGAWGHRLSGRVTLCGQDHSQPTPASSIAGGLVMVTDDRHRYGLHLDQAIDWNLTLSSLSSFQRHGLLDGAAALASAQASCKKLRIKTENLDKRVGGLSGGNQQKVVLGKALMTHPRVVFLDEPTRGIDVGAKLEVYHLINRLVAEGCAVVLVSSELPELLGLSDRILMLHEGQVTGEFTPDASQEMLLAAAMGQPLSTAA